MVQLQSIIKVSSVMGNLGQFGTIYSRCSTSPMWWQPNNSFVMQQICTTSSPCTTRVLESSQMKQIYCQSYGKKVSFHSWTERSNVVQKLLMRDSPYCQGPSLLKIADLFKHNLEGKSKKNLHLQCKPSVEALPYSIFSKSSTPFLVDQGESCVVGDYTIVKKSPCISVLPWYTLK